MYCVCHYEDTITLSVLYCQIFVVAVTVSRECYDEVKRYLRDKEVNSQVFSKLTIEGNTGDMYSIHNAHVQFVFMC